MREWPEVRAAWASQHREACINCGSDETVPVWAGDPDDPGDDLLQTRTPDYIGCEGCEMTMVRLNDGRLFVPLNSEFYWMFARGDKTVELRAVDDRFNIRTVGMGRPVELRRGYSTEDALWGYASDVFYSARLGTIIDHFGVDAIVPESTEDELRSSARELLGEPDKYVAFEVTQLP